MEKLDIRTHLIVLISATLFWFVFQSNAEIHGLVVLCALYMCVAGYWEKALGFIMTYIIMLLLAYLTAPIMGIMYVVICTFARAIPLTMVAAPILYANPSRMMYSFQRIHVPKNVLVMLCILIRFFPVIEKEMLSIRNGIRARGIFPTWWSILRKMNKSEIAKQLLGFMRAHKNQFVLSILLAILGVASGMIPYFAIARIMLYLLEGIREMSIYAFWCMMVLLGFSLKIIFANLSTAVSHTATFYTLKEIRMQIIDKLSRVPMGYILDQSSGSFKDTIVDRVESMEPILAHLVPEMTSNLFVPVCMLSIMFCSILFYLQGSMTLVYCLLMCVASFLIFSELEKAGGKSFALRLIESSIDKINEIDETPIMDLSGQNITPPNMDIELKDVSFSYGEHQIFRCINLSVPSRTTLAIVGPSGSGKTTLCSLIARFWDVQSGSITLGGTDIRDYTLDKLLSNFSIVFQNVYLFADTIENNIRFGKPDASHDEVVRVAKKACCHDFIMALPQGYDTVIGESGATLSGGEKQRISIARAILKDAPIVILDEATSSVDPENESDLQAAIESLTESKTVITIAHRLKTVKNADQIVVIADGKITQRGTHEQLKMQSGIYADFINIRHKTTGWKLVQ